MAGRCLRATADFTLRLGDAGSRAGAVRTAGDVVMGDDDIGERLANWNLLDPQERARLRTEIREATENMRHNRIEADELRRLRSTDAPWRAPAAPPAAPEARAAPTQAEIVSRCAGGA